MPFHDFSAGGVRSPLPQKHRCVPRPASLRFKGPHVYAARYSERGLSVREPTCCAVGQFPVPARSPLQRRCRDGSHGLFGPASLGCGSVSGGLARVQVARASLLLCLAQTRCSDHLVILPAERTDTPHLHRFVRGGKRYYLAISQQ